MLELKDDMNDIVVSEDEIERKIEEEVVGEEPSSKQPVKRDEKHDEKAGNTKDAAPTLIPMPRPPPPFPQRLKKKAEDGKFLKFISMLKQLSVNALLLESLEQMSGYAKFMKDLVTKKRTISFEPTDNLHHCSAIATRSFLQKKEDPDAFTIPCTIGVFNLAKALCDLDYTVKKPVGIIYDISVKVESFIFPADFVILKYEVDFDVPIILGTPFLATELALVDMETDQLKF
ncbi:uncharacterized protein LOC129899990 [Solanum dulcamara]|uniref:uncharacterized protein LOC129899990 n=1 Tax=Solanum dulcamara TaxID=45834 RepID=UPI002485C799|nr:uncharacterized protein LOC129899990 [Solanum dulcamara]